MKCPTVAQLQSFLDDTLEELHEDVVDHVETCVSCESTLADLADDPSMSRWRQTLQWSPPAIESPLPESEIGSSVGPYTLERVLGSGTFGVVYLARDNDGKPWAVKRFRPRVLSAVAANQLVQNECTLKGLSHPGLATVQEAALHNGQPYVVCEYVKGQTLREIMDAGELSTTEMVALVISTARAIAHLHRMDVFHCDLKPSNIIVRPDGRPCVVDFGLALREADQWQFAGDFAGTMPYMSPEQVRCKQQYIDGRSDLWALGVVLYELLASRRPFRGGREQLRAEILNRPARPFRQFLPHIPLELEEACLKALSVDPQDRYPTADDFADALEQAATHLERAPSKETSSPTDLSKALAQHTHFWSQKSSSAGRLPTLWEYYSFWRRTDRKDWTRDEQAMMASAFRRLSVWFVGIVIAVCSLLLIFSRYRRGQQQQRVEHLLARVGAAAIGELPQLAEDLYRTGDSSQTNARLEAALHDAIAENDTNKSLRYAFSLHSHAVDQSSLLCEQILDASENRLPMLATLLLESDALKSTDAEEIFRKAINAPGAGVDCQFEAWPTWSPADAMAIAQADGRITSSYALCHAMRMDEFLRVVRSLGKACFRPVRVRPFRDDGQLFVAAIWWRDQRSWDLEHDLDPKEFEQRHQHHSKFGAVLTDLCSYQNDTGHRICLGVWEHGVHAKSNYILDCPSQDYLQSRKEMEASSLQLASQSAATDSSGKLLVSSVWREGKQAEENDQAVVVVGEQRPDYLADINGLQDVAIVPATREQSRAERCAAQLELVQNLLAMNEDTPSIQMLQGRALHGLGQDAEAIESLAIPCNSPALRLFALPIRAMARGRSGDYKRAMDDLKRYEGHVKGRPRWKEWRQAYCIAWEAKIERWNGNLDFDRNLKEAVKRQPNNPDALLFAACAYAAAAEMNESDCDENLAQANALIDRSLQNGLDVQRIKHLPDLELIRTSRLAAVPTTSETSFVASWRPKGNTATFSVRPMTPEKHLAWAELYSEAGFRPASISVASDVRLGRVSSAVWHRRPLGENRDAEIARRANAIAALLRLTNDETIWKLLRDDQHRDLTNEVILRLPLVGVPPTWLLNRLAQDPPSREMRPLLLALGDYPWSQLDSGIQAQATAVIGALAEHVEPGVHSAAVWLARRWELPNHGAAQQAAAGPNPSKTGEESADWHVNSIGQTMVRIRKRGSFWIGSPDNEPHRSPIEVLRHRQLDHTFAMAATEVTAEQLRQFRESALGRRVASRQSRVTEAEANVAAADVTYYEAAAFCNWLSAQEGIDNQDFCYLPNDDNEYGPGMRIAGEPYRRKGYRLPTDVEWELACRAGARSAYPHGESDRFLSRFAHCAQEERRLAPVGSLRPNAFGLFDMCGGVLEWIHKPMLSEKLEVTPNSRFSTRGGSLALNAGHARCADRVPMQPHSSGQHGIRLVRTLDWE